MLRKVLLKIRKKVVRGWLANPLHRRKVLRQQEIFLNAEFKPNGNRLIVFLVPGVDMVGGGVLSIMSLADETERVSHVHGADVYVSPCPGELPLLRFTKFENSRMLVDLELLLSRYSENGQDVLIHIPEVYLQRFLRNGKSIIERFFGANFKFNIMLQNIDYIPEKKDVVKLKMMGETTCTTAHESYSNKETEGRIGCPIFHFSVWISPEQYQRISYNNKQNLIVISPDSHPKKEQIISDLQSDLKEYEFRVIQGLTYEEYKELISKAKFSLTFGEGLDAYFVETIFSGGIGCAVYNDRFFTEDFMELPFVFQSWEGVSQRLSEKIMGVDNSEEFMKVNSSQYDRLSDLYSFDRYQENIKRFYSEVFSN